jgi:hypothetical protein
MLNLEAPAHVHITLIDEAFPAEAGSVTPPAPCPDPVYSVFDPTGIEDWTGLGRRSGDVGVRPAVGAATVAVVAPWVAVS